MFYFQRLFYIDNADLLQFRIRPFDEFKELRMADELLDHRRSDHVPSASLDQSRAKAEACIRSDGAGYCLSTDPGVIVLSDHRMFPTSPQNFAFVWAHPTWSGALVVPMKVSSVLSRIEKHRKAARVHCPTIFGIQRIVTQ